MKKVLGVLAICLLFFSAFALAQPSAPNIDGGDVIINATENTREFIEEEKWEYLGEQWKDLLLKSKGVSTLDSFLQKFNIVFVILFGEPYDLSLTLLISMMLWAFFFFMFANILSTFSTFSKLISYLIALGMAIISAQIRLYSLISEIIFKIIFFRDGIWSWVSFACLLILYILGLTFMKMIVRLAKERKKVSAADQQAIDQKVLHKTVEGINEANEDE